MTQRFHVIEKRIAIVELLGAVDAHHQVHLTPDVVDELDLKKDKFKFYYIVKSGHHQSLVQFEIPKNN